MSWVVQSPMWKKSKCIEFRVVGGGLICLSEVLVGIFRVRVKVKTLEDCILTLQNSGRVKGLQLIFPHLQTQQKMLGGSPNRTKTCIKN